MSKLQAYDPQDGYMYQIFCRNPNYGRAFEHCDYAESREEAKRLIGEYRMAYGAGWEFRKELLPTKCWPQFQPKPAGV